MELTVNQRWLIASAARDLGAIFVVAFGSAVRGEERADSDLDIAVLAKQKPNYEFFTKAYSSFSEIFRGKNVDVRFLNDADPLFTMQVVRDGILLYGDTDAYDALKMLANRRYVDDGAKYFPLFDEQLKEQQRQLKGSAL